MSSDSSRTRIVTARAARSVLLRLLFILPLALLAQPSGARAQQSGGARQRNAQPEIIDDEDVLKIDTDLVLVDVTVTDAAGKPVRGLRPEDFKLYEDGDERAVAFLNVERRGGTERPVAVVFAVDVSGSMTAEEMARLQTAMRAFSDKLSNRPASFALMSFGMSARVLQHFTSDPRKLDHALERLHLDPIGLSTTHYAPLT